MTPGICDRNFQAVDSDSDAYRPPSIGIKPNPSEYRYVLAPQGVASDCASRNDPGRDRNHKNRRRTPPSETGSFAS